MLVHSLSLALSLSLVTFVSAQDNSSSTYDSGNSSDVYWHGMLNPVGFNSPTKRWVPPQSARRNPVKRAQAGICDALPNKWSYMGCYADDPSQRVLAGPSYCEDRTGHDGMTQEKCIEYCDQRGYSLAGVEFSKECFCGYTVDASLKSPEADCRMTCSGNGDEVCGAGGRINIFTNGDSAPAILAAAGDFQSQGCYSDSASARTLTTRISLPGNVRVTDCTSACSAQGFQYAGLEYGSECYCGSSIQNGGQPIADKSCNMACTADKTQYCGGRAAINVYKSNQVSLGPSDIPDGWKSMKCYTDNPSKRTLSYKVPNFSKFSNEQCITKCDSLGYNYAGTEYGSECYCGAAIDNGNAATSGCDMACNGLKSDTCGGAGRINIFKKSCARTPDCTNGYGFISGGYELIKLSECYQNCHMNADCKTFQWGIDLAGYPGKGFCLLYSYASDLVRSYHGDDPYCQAYSVYDASCVF